MSYSRLPVPTSARSSLGSGIQRSRLVGEGNGTSFKYSGLGTNYPGTVKKANLFTPQNKKISFPTGASTQSSNRNSLAPDRKYSKDTRPIADRDYQQACFEKLADFLIAHQYPYPPPDPKRFFQTVSKTDSVHIFEFLLNFFFMSEQPFKITHIEIDVPRALKQINYPFTVTKSNLVSVASRQSIATLLSIFDWLVNSIEYFSNLDDVDSSDDIGSSNVQTQIIAELFKMATIAENEEQLESLMMELSSHVHGCEEEVLLKENEIEVAHGKLRKMQDYLQNSEGKITKGHEYREQTKLDELESSNLNKEMQDLMFDKSKSEQEIAEALAEYKLMEEKLGESLNEECIAIEKERLNDLNKKFEFIKSENARDEHSLREREAKYATTSEERFREETTTLRDLDDQMIDLAREAQKNDNMEKDIDRLDNDFEESSRKEQEDLTNWVKNKLEMVNTNVQTFLSFLSRIQDLTDNLESIATESRESRNLY